MGSPVADYRKHAAVLRALHATTPVWDAADRAALDAAATALESVGDLAMLVRMLVHKVQTFNPHSDLAKRAMDYLTRHGLQGSPLRGDPTDSVNAE